MASIIEGIDSGCASNSMQVLISLTTPEVALKSAHERCLNRNVQVVNSDLPDDLKKQFCSCYSSGFSSEVGNTVLLNEFLFRKTMPIQEYVVI